MSKSYLAAAVLTGALIMLRVGFYLLNSGPTPYQPPNPANPGFESNPVISQLNHTFFDPSRTAQSSDNLIEQGFSTGVPTTRNGVGRQWAIDGWHLGNPSLLEYDSHGRVKNPLAVWFWHSIGSMGPVAASIWQTFKFTIGYANLPPPNIKMPVIIWGNGFGNNIGDAHDRLMHQVKRGFAVFGPRVTVDDNIFDPNPNNKINFPEGITNRAMDDIFLLDWLEEINAPGSGHYLSGHLDLDHLIVMDWSDGTNGHACMMMGCGAPYNVPVDSRMRKAFWMPEDPVFWEDMTKWIKNLFTRAFMYLSQQVYGFLGGLRGHHDNQCPIAYFIRLHNTTHSHFAPSINRLAEAALYTGDIKNSVGLCNATAGIAICYPKNSANVETVTKFIQYADDVAINALLFRSEHWTPLMNLTVAYGWVNPHGYIVHDKGGDKVWNGSYTAAHLELEYDDFGDAEFQAKEGYKSYSSSGSNYVPDPVHEDGNFTYWSHLPVPLSKIRPYWAPFPPGQPTTCPC